MSRNSQLINLYVQRLKNQQNYLPIIYRSKIITDKRAFPLNIRKLSNDELTKLNLDKLLSLKPNIKPNKYKQFNLTNRIKNKIDLRDRFPPICDQGELASCTANALCGLMAYTYNYFIGSRLFLYYNERLLINNVKFDDGAYLSDGIITLKQNGICPESLWTYNNHFSKRPPTYCYDIALRHKIYKVYNLTNSLQMMKQYLSNGYPFVLGIGLYKSFMSKNVAFNGIVPMPNTITETFMGGHAVVCVGYNNTTGYWIMRNSWGTSWGDNGYFYLPYAYLLDINLCSDIWTFTKL